MSHVYRVASLDDVFYFNTRREACRCKPGGEEPEGFDILDAAQECKRLHREVEGAERRFWDARLLLIRLWAKCPTDEVRDAKLFAEIDQFFESNPMPAATSDPRDGGRNYGV